MKLERINENQIRCIISRGELLKRNITLSKLTTQSSESRALIREILEQAYDELDFRGNGGPLMIEAAPLSEGNIAFTLTKADGAPAGSEIPTELSATLQHLLDMAQSRAAAEAAAPPEPRAHCAIFGFEAGKRPELPASLTRDPVGIHSALYLSARNKTYYLCVTAAPRYTKSYRSLCCLLQEYGRRIPGVAASEDYCREHYREIFPKNALKHLHEGDEILTD